MKTLKDIYFSVMRGNTIINENDFVKAFERENPEFVKEGLKIQNQKWIECLDTMLRNFNPKWNPEDRSHSNDFWIYFNVDGKHITPQQVHDHFIDLIRENEKYRIRYGELRDDD